VGLELELPFERIAEGLARFVGVDRRFQRRGEAGGITVIDDYGHHPAEVRATLRGARESFGRRVVCLFQPHRYTRTRDLFDEFTTSFNDADVLLLTEVYAASEDPIPGVSGAALAAAVRACGHRDVTFVAERAALARAARARVRPGDIVLTLGAGDVTQAGPELLALLSRP
jgi:UDP-N-acetylmuramate--alanine ligase